MIPRHLEVYLPEGVHHIFSGVPFAIRTSGPSQRAGETVSYENMYA
jgi:hypothetical protein